MSQNQIPTPAELVAFIRATGMRFGNGQRALPDLPGDFNQALDHWQMYRRRIYSASQRRLSPEEASERLGISSRTLRDYLPAIIEAQRFEEDPPGVEGPEPENPLPLVIDSMMDEGFSENDLALLKAERERRRKAKGAPGGKAAAAKRLKRSGKKR